MVCPVCYENYENTKSRVPRILPCGHTFCTECIEKFLKESATSRLTCPLCNKSSTVPDVKSIIVNYAALPNEDDDEATPAQKHEYHCGIHKQEKIVYCKDHKELICLYCNLSSGTHSNCKIVMVKEMTEPLLDKIRNAKDHVAEMIKKIDGADEELREMVEMLKGDKERVKQTVEEFYDSLMQTMKDEKEKTVKKLEEWTEEQVEILEAQQDTFKVPRDENAASLKSCQEVIHGNHLDLLLKPNINPDEVVGRVTSCMENLSLTPLLSETVSCTVTDRKETALRVLMNQCKVSYEKKIKATATSAAAAPDMCLEEPEDLKRQLLPASALDTGVEKCECEMMPALPGPGYDLPVSDAAEHEGSAHNLVPEASESQPIARVCSYSMDPLISLSSSPGPLQLEIRAASPSPTSFSEDEEYFINLAAPGPGPKSSGVASLSPEEVGGEELEF